MSEEDQLLIKQNNALSETKVTKPAGIKMGFLLSLIFTIGIGAL